MDTQRPPDEEAQDAAPSVDNGALSHPKVGNVFIKPNTKESVCSLIASKMRGGDAKPLPVPPLYTMAMSFIGTFGALLAVAGINIALAGRISLPLLLAPFGASATLLFAMGSQPAAQPRNVSCGMLLSCAAGVLSRTLFGANVIAAAPVAVAGAISAMQATSTVHPPGGAMALLLAVLEPLVTVTPAEAASISFKVDRASDWCIQGALEPSMAARLVHGLELTMSAIIGQAVLFAVALVVNNIGPASTKYPTMW